jgi:hypothetical protein
LSPGRVQSQPGQHSKTLSVRKEKLRAGGVAQVVEGLPRKLEVLSSNSSAIEKKKKRERKGTRPWVRT